MKTTFRNECALVLFAIGLILVGGCARSPEAQKARHLERGDRYFSEARFREAVIEYRNVLSIDPANLPALRQIALAHYQLGEWGQSLGYLLKSKELAPDDPEVRLKLGTILLRGGRPDDARSEAVTVLEASPKSLDALLILAAAAVKPDDVDAALKRFESARDALETQAKFQIALGSLYLRKREIARAERAFLDAVAREPNSAESYLALGDFYVVKRDPTQAELAFKKATAMAPVGSTASLKLVDFYLVTGRRDEATRTLREITEKAPDYVPAWRRLAELQIGEGRYDEAERSVAPILKANPSDLDGLLQLGRIRLARREAPEAIQQFQKVLTLEPRLAIARYHLAQAYLLAGNLHQAKAELNETMASAPNYTEAALLLAELNIQTGAVAPAIVELEALTTRQPQLSHAYLLLGSAYLAKKEPGKAAAAYRKLVALAPKDPRGPYLVGLALRAQGDTGGARREFEASLALATEYIEPLAQLAYMALAEKQPAVAVARVQQQIALRPKSGALRSLLGDVYILAKQDKLAEGAFVKALELDARLVGALVQLGRLYSSSGRLDQALQELEAALRVNPRNVVALTLSGVVYERRGDVPRAQRAYEQAVTVDPRFAPAANNLAWLYTQHGGDQEKALQLARTANEVAPDDPRIADTLGWILYRRGIFRNALSLFEASAAKLPTEPEVQYHLGMAYYKLENRAGARDALIRALRIRDEFPGADDARRTLASL